MKVDHGDTSGFENASITDHHLKSKFGSFHEYKTHYASLQRHLSVLRETRFYASHHPILVDPTDGHCSGLADTVLH
jgi:hypothetical protein